MSTDEEKRRKALEWIAQIDYDNDTVPDGWPEPVERSPEELQAKIEAQSGPVIITRKPPKDRPMLPPEVWPHPPEEIKP